MLTSMTGFGSSAFELRDNQYQIEIKALNSKGFDFFYKSPTLFKHLEIQLKSQILKSLERGKVELNIQSKDGKKGFFSIEESLFVQQYDFLKSLADKVNSTIDIFPLVVSNYSNLSDVEDLTEEEMKTIISAVENCCLSVGEFRAQEGEIVTNDVTDWVNKIDQIKSKIALIEPQRIDNRREKLLQGIKEFTQANEIDYNRLGQEMIFYIEKLDISEEISRLTQHIILFNQTMNLAESNGKKLGFIAQEMGREINTIGSKANDSEIQHLVVEMKDYLERIKEQLNNIV